MLHHIVKLKEVGYGGVLKAVDSELVTKEFKKTQSFTMRNRTIPVCRYEICVHLKLDDTSDLFEQISFVVKRSWQSGFSTPCL